MIVDFDDRCKVAGQTKYLGFVSLFFAHCTLINLVFCVYEFFIIKKTKEKKICLFRFLRVY